MLVRQFLPADLAAIRLQAAQQWLKPTIGHPEYMWRLMKGETYTARDYRGVLSIGCLFTLWPGRMELCALLSELVGPGELLSLHRAVRRFLAGKHGRIEATVESDFEEGHRWMGLLGFLCETPDGMRGYLPDGRSSYLYARVT